MVIRVAAGVRDERNEEANQDNRHGASEMRFLHRPDQHRVRLHVEAIRKSPHRAEDGIGEQHADEDHQVHHGDREEQEALPRLAVIELPESRNDGQHGSSAGISCRLFKTAWSYGSRHLLLQLEGQRADS